MKISLPLPALLLILLAAFFPAAIHAADPAPALRQFLLSTPGTYGWQPVKGDISYDFFPDGRLHVQGSDGEATMWEGTWKLSGDQLTLKVPARKTNETLTATIQGGDLLLDGQRYKRYQP